MVLAWTPQSSGVTDTLPGVAWSGSQFVAVGDTGRILSSPDGVTWTPQSSGVTNVLYGVGASGSQFVAVGDTGRILSSPDGVTWTSRSSGVTEVLRSVAWSGSQFVVVGNTGRILTSTNGTSWFSRSSGVTNVLYGVAWSGSQFVVVGYGGRILTSADGVTWTPQSSGVTETLRSVAWSGSLFVVVGSSGRILSSPDGVTWTSQSSGVTNILYGVAWSGSQFVAVGDSGRVLTSADGVTWTPQSSGVTNILYGVAWSGSQFVAVGDSGRILTAPENQAPNAPTLTTPTSGSTLNRQQDQTFAWQFNDPDPGDTQSAYNFAYRPVGAATWTETGWVAVTSSQHVVPAGTFAFGDYEWRVYTKDAQGEASPPSATGFFTAADPPPAPTITDPANNGTIPSEEYPVTWSTPDQDAYQVQVLDGTVVLYDTQQVNSTNRYRTLTFPDNGVTRTVRVRVLFRMLWSAWATATVTVSYTPPAQPTVTLTPDGAALVVTATHPAPAAGQPTVTGMDVWIRGGPEGEFRLAADVPPSQQVVWHLPASGVEYEARVRAIGENGTSTFSEWTT